MGLLIRYDPVEHALRSVGDPPNGVIVLLCEGDGGRAGFAVSPSYQGPPATPSDGIEIDKQIVADRPADATDIEEGDLFDACASGIEVGYLIHCAAAGVVAAAQDNAIGAVPVRVEFLQAHVDFLLRIRTACMERGIIGVREEPDGE